MSSWNSDIPYEIGLFGCDGRHDDGFGSSFFVDDMKGQIGSLVGRYRRLSAV